MNFLFLKPKLFISYSREKLNVAELIESELMRKGYHVFFDKETIMAGDPFPMKIENFLKTCDGVIILISNVSIESEWCRYEYYSSFFKGKTIIPIITEKIKNDKESRLIIFKKILIVCNYLMSHQKKFI